MADLKRDIIVVNRYSKRSSHDSRGSRGSSPGQYVLRYMARSSAVEVLPVIGERTPDTFVTRYMLRSNAVQGSPNLAVALNETHTHHPGHDYFRYSGAAFGVWRDPVTDSPHACVSMSDTQVVEAATQIQRAFDTGERIRRSRRKLKPRAVYETIISFSGDYLERMGVLVDAESMDLPRHKDGTIDDKRVREGAYRGHIDQAKLRLAIMHGLERTSLAQAGLTYVGVIQVDTGNVHCHLAMVTDRDAPGGSRKDGVISPRQTMNLRRGIDAQLDDTRAVATLAATTQRQRFDLVASVETWVTTSTEAARDMQQLISCLPEDRRLWRAGSKAKVMGRPNTIATMMVERALERHPDQMARWHEGTERYIAQRREREGERNVDAEALRREARRRLVDRCVNGIYREAKRLDADREITPMMHYMRIDRGRITAELTQHRDAKGADANAEADARLAQFALRARNYAERLAEHARLELEYLRRWFEFARNTLMAVEDNKLAAAVARFYLDEADYQGRCVDKYHRFIPAATGPDDLAHWAERWDREIRPERARADHAAAMLADPAFDEWEAGQWTEADDYAWRRYGVDGGGRMLTEEGRRTMRTVTVPLFALHAAYTERRLKAEARAAGVVFDGHGTPSLGTEHDFWDVRGVDIHDMRDDSVVDEPVGRQALGQFDEAVHARHAGMMALIDYARSIAGRTGVAPQTAAGREPVAHDITAMITTYNDLAGQRGRRPVLRSRIAGCEAAHEAETMLTRRTSAPDAIVDPDPDRIVETILADETAPHDDTTLD